AALCIFAQGSLTWRIPAKRAEPGRTTQCSLVRQGCSVAGKEASIVLVLTRRENERILLPDVGVTVELMSVTGNRARLGISAPDNIRILREEVAASQDALKHALSRGPVSREFAHALRNRLNAAILATETVRLQIEAGHLAETSASLDRIVAELRAMASMVQGTSPAPPAPVLAGTNGSHRPWKALVVEDDANESLLLAGILRMTGYEVDIAGDGSDALDYLHSHERPDVVLLDMKLPKVDGPTTLGRIRRDPALEGMKVYAVSATPPKRFGLKTGPGGIDRWFCKPLDPRELVRQLDTELSAIGR
ncbi:MAG TPA: response regulator, partial [Planctomycetaceae bacterium]|nr:response regulator [Planctomycetaceae bacterium]